MTTTESDTGGRRIVRRMLWVLIVGGVAGISWTVGEMILGSPELPKPPPLPRTSAPSGLRSSSGTPVRLASGRQLTVWWDSLPSFTPTQREEFGTTTNVHPIDYVGSESCQACHPANYQTWSQHPHRWMNALADQTTVRGDFSEAATIAYRGGRANFTRDADHYLMHLERGNVKRSYRITQTIGMRFYQYYVGRQIEGPEPETHHFYHKDHVLPFGYWLEAKQWVPTVHIGPEKPDAERPDPYLPPDKGPHYAEYAASCNYCHTTFALGDLFGRRAQQIGEHAPIALHWSMKGYLQQAHPDALKTLDGLSAGTSMRNPLADWDAKDHAVSFGISCEACHLGARAHVESRGQTLPRFFPHSPFLFAEADQTKLEFGRHHDNLNWSCGRCHTGGRPRFAAGMSTWNSVEYSDAMLGSCYSQLRCIDCHNPHRATGPRWTRTPDQDDAVCLKCHDQYRQADRRLAHTHHPAGSEGDRCLNCHMPRINEGLQEVVRTHMIYSPTRTDMIQANQPSACNLCHTEKPIDWTLGHLKQWYGKTYDDTILTSTYPQRARPVALGWLASPNEAVRLVAADALTRARDRSALPQLLEALDDRYLLNRQFAGQGLEHMLGLRLSDFGYRFYQSAEERRQPLTKLREHLQKTRANGD